MKRIITIAASVLGIVTLSGLFIARSYTNVVVQPIAFNHQKHLETGVECFGCHETVKESAIAGKPRLETCMLCHEAPLGQTAAEKTVTEYAARNEEIPWRRLYKLPDHVFFPHQTHVLAAQIDCKTCHGGIGESATPPGKSAIEFAMDDCIACHQKKGVTNDCIACHR